MPMNVSDHVSLSQSRERVENQGQKPGPWALLQIYLAPNPNCGHLVTL